MKGDSGAKKPRTSYDGLFELGLVPEELRGLNIIPARLDKTPLIPWKEYQTRRYDGDYELGGNYAFAAICGWRVDPYGYLAVLDLDDPIAYERFKDVETFTVRTVSGGYHLYFWVREPPKTKPIAPGVAELKGSGSCITVPFSFGYSKRTGELAQYRPVKRVPMPAWPTFSASSELEEFVRSRLGEEPARARVTVEEGIAREVELSEEGVLRVVEVLRPYYRVNVRNYIVLYLSGWLRKAGVSYGSARRVIELLTEGDEERAKRLYVLDRTYELCGSPPKPEEMKGKTGLLEVLSQLAGPEEAQKVVRELEEVIESAARRVAVAEGVAPVLEARRKLTPLELAHRAGDVVLQKFTVRTFYLPTASDGDVHCYEDGVYVPCEARVKEAILSAIPQEYKDRFSTKIEREALLWIKRNTMQMLSYEPLVLAFNNVLLNLECYFLEDRPLKECVEEPSPDRIVFHKIPHPLPLDVLDAVETAEFEVLAEKLAPRITKAFKDWVGEKWRLLYEIAGYVFWPRYDLHKAVMLVGDGKNGKSTYLKLLTEMLGKNNCVSVSLKDITEKRFAPAQLHRRLANIYPDLPSFILKETGIFKALTGEDSITADRKFREPITFTNYAKLLFSANELPEVHDMTEAFWRRWIVVQFPNKFPPNPKFFETLVPEIPYLIVLGLRAFKEVWKRARFSFEETEEDYKHQWLYRSNSVYAFLHDMRKEGRIEVREDARVETGELYSLYAQYCVENDRKPLDKARFTMEMERLGYKKVGTRGRYYYRGLEIKPEGQGEGLEVFT